MNTQLYKLSPPEFVEYVFGKKAEDVYLPDSTAIPWLRWPNKHWCIEANGYLQSLRSKGFSIRGKGGTLGTYAAYLTPLLHYCYNSKINLIKLTDKDFQLAIKGLAAEKVIKKGILSPKRNSTTINKIGGTWLDFLSYVGSYNNEELFVGEEYRIRGYKKKTIRKTSDGKFFETERWYHPCFPTEEPLARRLPISDSQLSKLRQSAETNSKSEFQRFRRLVMLELFETSGFRRMEAALLRVSDVRKAIKEYKEAQSVGNVKYIPVLSFRTVKKRSGKYGKREVPIDSITLSFLESYGRMRKRHLKSLGLHLAEDGPLFVNEKTGKALRPNTITQEFHKLATLAGINEQCCPHMMRHRYITKAFVRLILAHELSDQDSFRKLLLDSRSFKMKIAEITGHASEDSLNVYINLAFDEVAGLEQTMSRVQAQAYADALDAATNRFRAKIQRGESAAAAGEELANAIESARDASRRWINDPA